MRGREGGGFRPIMLEILIVRYELKGKVRTRPEIFRVVFGTCAQFCPVSGLNHYRTESLTG